MAVSKISTLILLVFLVLLLVLFLSFHQQSPEQHYFRDQEDLDVPVTESNSLPKAQRVVLVTGAAGFIGFHISVAMVMEWRARVVGLDSFSLYYDVQLKRDRANELVRVGVSVYRGDVCDKSLLHFLFAKYNFTHVIHMAAQGGVRHSMKAPHEYLGNIECFLSLLEVVRDHQNVPLVYASSSTVYGHHSPLPFSPPSTLLVPSNIYAATKMANEHFADTFCSQHGLRVLGVRFFTVYGPWGRPDMAVYRFAESLYENKTLMFHNATTPPTRDFTFVRDIVRGVLLAVDHVTSPSGHVSLRCGEVYNIGSGRSVGLMQVLRLLMKELNASAKIEYRGLPEFDLPATLADISMSRRVLGYAPRTGVEEGLREFVQWFKEYMLLRKEGREEERNSLLERVLVRGEREVEEVRRRETEEGNAQYRDRIQRLKQKYKKFAEEMKIEQPSNLSHKRFVHYQGMDSPGSTIIKAHGYQGNTKLMKQRCQETEQCVAFNSNGEFKSRLKSRNQWVRTSESESLYVADLDLCSADLHSCGRHQDCIYSGPSSHECACQEGFSQLGSGCVPRYVEGVVSEMEKNMQLCDYFDGLNWEKMISKKEFVFFQGLDSPGGDYLVVGRGKSDKGRGHPDVEHLKRICRETEHCVGFNTNGILKHSLRPPHRWTPWSAVASAGLYVIDVNYCQLSSEACPPHARCHRVAPGNYTCVCDPPWVMTSAHTCEIGQVEPERGVADVRRVEKGVWPVHVIVSTDAEDFAGLVTLLSSLVTYSASPRHLHVHVVLAGTNEATLRQYLQCHSPSPSLSLLDLDVVQLDPQLLEGRVHVYSSEQEVGKLSSLGNFARFFFHELLPGVGKALYLDVDAVLNADVVELWRQLLASEQLLLAVPRSTPTYGDFFSAKVQDLFLKRYGRKFDLKEMTFNAGVYGVNLDLWRQQHIHEEVLYWLDKQAEEPLWRFGTQPVMLLVAHRQWTYLDPLWNVNGLGWNKNLDRKDLGRAKLLHWSGRRKPWLPDGLYKDLWTAYKPLECSGRGQCIAASAPDGIHFKCRCQRGYTGAQCQLQH